MFTQLLQYSDFGLLMLRIVVAIIFIYHALPKIRSSRLVARGMDMSQGFVFVLGWVELLSSIGLILGIYIQLASLLLSIVMTGAIYSKMIRWRMPFSSREGTGWEFDFILLAANIMILLSGGGGFALFK